MSVIPVIVKKDKLVKKKAMKKIYVR